MLLSTLVKAAAMVKSDTDEDIKKCRDVHGSVGVYIIENKSLKFGNFTRSGRVRWVRLLVHWHR